MVIFPKAKKEMLDDFWTSVLLAIIGESLNGIEEVRQSTHMILEA